MKISYSGTTATITVEIDAAADKDQIQERIDSGAITKDVGARRLDGRVCQKAIQLINEYATGLNSNLADRKAQAQARVDQLNATKDVAPSGGAILADKA